MRSCFVPIVVVAFALFQPAVLRWVNQYDQFLKFECPVGEHLSRLESQHSNKREDRVWNFECRKGFVTDSCRWSGYQNIYDQALDFKCPDDELIAGLMSYHSNKHEDRSWQFKCCSLSTKSGKNCATTDYINDWDDYMNYIVEPGSAIRGFESYHQNRQEDRRWKVHHCEYTICRAKSVEFLEVLETKAQGTKVVGIATSQGCSPGATYTTTLEQQKGMEETYSIQDTKEHSFTTSVSISVGFTVGVFRKQANFEVTTSFAHGYAFSKTLGHEMTRSFSAGSSQALEYTGPGAALIIADCKEYKTSQDEVEVEYTIECDDGDSYKEKSKVSVTAHTYGQTHYMQKHATFNETAGCTPETEACIDDIAGKNAPHSHEVIQDFENCFHDKTSIF